MAQVFRDAFESRWSSLLKFRRIVIRTSHFFLGDKPKRGKGAAP